MRILSALTCLFMGEPEIGDDLLLRLGDRGVRVINAATGQRAIDLVYQFTPAIIVLGGGLQDISTCKVYRHLKLNLPRNIPIILFYDDTHPASLPVIASPGDEAIAKPIDPEALSRKIFDTLLAATERNERIAIGMEADCVEGGTTIEGLARNISEGGIFIETDYEPRPGEQVTLSLRPSERLDPYQRRGKVIHCRGWGCDYRFAMGVQFAEQKLENREIIFAFLSDKLLPAST